MPSAICGTAHIDIREADASEARIMSSGMRRKGSVYDLGSGTSAPKHRKRNLEAKPQIQNPIRIRQPAAWNRRLNGADCSSCCAPLKHVCRQDPQGTHMTDP